MEPGAFQLHVVNKAALTSFLPFFVFFLYLLTKRYIRMYCRVQREQDNKAQITGTNSCPFSLKHSNR